MQTQKTLIRMLQRENMCPLFVRYLLETFKDRCGCSLGRSCVIKSKTIILVDVEFFIQNRL